MAELSLTPRFSAVGWGLATGSQVLPFKSERLGVGKRRLRPLPCINSKRACLSLTTVLQRGGVAAP